MTNQSENKAHRFKNGFNATKVKIVLYVQISGESFCFKVLI